MFKSFLNQKKKEKTAILKMIFNFFEEDKLLQIIKFSKKMQEILNIDKSQFYFSNECKNNILNSCLYNLELHKLYDNSVLDKKFINQKFNEFLINSSKKKCIILDSKSFFDKNFIINFDKKLENIHLRYVCRFNEEKINESLKKKNYIKELSIIVNKNEYLKGFIWENIKKLNILHLLPNNKDIFTYLLNFNLNLNEIRVDGNINYMVNLGKILEKNKDLEIIKICQEINPKEKEIFFNQNNKNLLLTILKAICKLKNVKYLEFPLEKDIINTLFESNEFNFEKLIYFYFKPKYQPNDLINYYYIKNIPEKLINLKAITLNWCNKSFFMLNKLLDKNKFLEIVQIISCNYIQDNEIDIFIKNINSLINLKFLQLKIGYNKNLGNICQHIKNQSLEKLEIFEFNSLTSDFISNLPNLKKLFIRGFSNENEIEFKIYNLYNIESLTLYNIDLNFTSIENIFNHKKLIELSINSITLNIDLFNEIILRICNLEILKKINLNNLKVKIDKYELFLGFDLLIKEIKNLNIEQYNILIMDEVYTTFSANENFINSYNENYEVEKYILNIINKNK